MPPSEAKVFVVEDDLGFQNTLTRLLTQEKHQVVATATTRDEALATVPRLRELGVQVVTLDGNLGEYNAGLDGRIILAAIKDQCPEIKTVGLSGNKFPGTDFDLGKLETREIGRVVTDL